MGLLSSIFGKKTTQNTSGTSNINSTTERTTPSWLDDITQGFAGKIKGLSDQGGNFYTGADPLQTKAYGTAAGLGSWGGPGTSYSMADPLSGPAPTAGASAAFDPTFMDAVGGVPGKTGMAGTSPLEGAGASAQVGAMPAPTGSGNPFLDALDITKATTGQGPATSQGASFLDNFDQIAAKFAPRVDSALADYDKGAGDAAAQLSLDQAGSGAFGNSGGTLERAALADSLARGRATTADTIRSDADRFAAGLAVQDAGMRQDTGQFNAGASERSRALDNSAASNLAGIASAFGGENRADVGTQATLGQVFRDIASGAKTADADAIAQLEQLFSGLPLDMYGGQKVSGTTTTTGKSSTVKNGSLADNIGQALQIAQTAAAMAASDRRLKRDVVRIGERPDGLGLYAFRYLWDDILRVGVMAQEVLRVKPKAVVTLPSGFMAVDYGAL